MWTKGDEVSFFRWAIPQYGIGQLFYPLGDGRQVAYIPRNVQAQGTVLQGRNTPIGDYTENWCLERIGPLVNGFGLHLVRKVICQEANLSGNSPADLAICTSPERRQPLNGIKLIFEVKMSIVWNWLFAQDELQCIGDYNSHRGQPGTLRSDSMLKAIGKAAIVRLSTEAARAIPIVVLSNTPMRESYYPKVDSLVAGGLFQGCWSLNPRPTDVPSSEDVPRSTGGGFLRMENMNQLSENLSQVLSSRGRFVSRWETLA